MDSDILKVKRQQSPSLSPTSLSSIASVPTTLGQGNANNTTTTPSGSVSLSQPRITTTPTSISISASPTSFIAPFPPLINGPSVTVPPLGSITPTPTSSSKFISAVTPTPVTSTVGNSGAQSQSDAEFDKVVWMVVGSAGGTVLLILLGCLGFSAWVAVRKRRNRRGLGGLKMKWEEKEFGDGKEMKIGTGTGGEEERLDLNSYLNLRMVDNEGELMSKPLPPVPNKKFATEMENANIKATTNPTTKATEPQPNPEPEKDTIDKSTTTNPRSSTASSTTIIPSTTSLQSTETPSRRDSKIIITSPSKLPRHTHTSMQYYAHNYTHQNLLDPDSDRPTSSNSINQLLTLYTPHSFPARFPHTPSLPDEISILARDTILVEQVFKDGWAFGWNVRTGKRGMFPLCCFGEEREGALRVEFGL